MAGIDTASDFAADKGRCLGRRPRGDFAAEHETVVVAAAVGWPAEPASERLLRRGAAAGAAWQMLRHPSPSFLLGQMTACLC